MSLAQTCSAPPFAATEMRVGSTESNGPNRAVALAHPGLFTAEAKSNGGRWTALSWTNRADKESFDRLIARVCSGQIDPREHHDDGVTFREIRLVAVPA
ncbi:MAG: hypothetical protein ABIV50_13075 [Opitutus sp.]